jgi:hypothetical protein
LPALHQVRSLSEDHIQCSALVSPNPLWFAKPNESASDVAADMAAYGFDVAPVFPSNSFRFVTAAALTSVEPQVNTDSVAQPITAGIVLGMDAPLADAIELLRDGPFFFIQYRREIVGIVTRADLSHPAVSSYVFQSLLSIETGLDSLIPSYAPQHVWLDEILKKDKRKILEVFGNRQEFNAETTLFDAMMLRHRIEVLEALPDLRADVVTTDAEELFVRRRKEKESRPLDHLRNTLAHGGSLLHAFPDPEDALNVLHKVESLATRIWQLVVDGREQLWKAYGRTILSWAAPTPVNLNGPHAAKSLPMTCPIFAISACNPFDRKLSETRNNERTARLASAVSKVASKHWTGRGDAVDGSYSESTVFAEGLDIETALEIGMRFGQRAIFRIDVESVSVLICSNGLSSHTWRRCWDHSNSPTLVASSDETTWLSEHIDRA